MHVFHQTYKQTYYLYMFTCGLKRFRLVWAAVGAVDESNQFDCFFFQAFSDGVLVLLAEVLCSPREIASQPVLYVALAPCGLEIFLAFDRVVLA